MRRIKIIFLAADCLFLLTAGAAYAYSLPGQGSLTPDIPASPSIKLNWNTVLNNLSSPFQNFGKSLESAAQTPVSNFAINTSSIAIPQPVSSGAQTLWDRFDSWLFGLSGFHISLVFKFILQIIEGVLGFVKVVIDWFLSLFH